MGNAEGSPAARYRELEAELPRLRQFTRFLTGNAEQAEDLFQDVMERALRRLDDRESAAGLRAWLFSIARNRHIDLHRRAERRPDSLVPAGELDRMPGAAVRREDVPEPFLRDFRKAYHELPPEFKEVFWLVGVQELRYCEAAQVLAVPLGTVRSRMFRARRLLEDALAAYR